jgi:predicted Zn-dependent protease with MMP-like domain
MLPPEIRRFFDQQLELVLRELPAEVLAVLDEIPLLVEDHPSKEVLRNAGHNDPNSLCGLYSGVPLTQPQWRGETRMPDQIYLYRQGILRMAISRTGELKADRLREEIRITIMHEVGHHHGLDEDNLDELGYG